MFRYVDLFAGCGGLSLGLENVGGECVLAVEKSDMAAQTFYRNFVDAAIDPAGWRAYLDRPLAEQARSGLAVSELRKVLDDREFHIAGLDIDVVVGGPPCQGFSLAGRRDPEDTRNRLPWEFLEFVERAVPKVVLIENVVGMSRSFSDSADSSFQQVMSALRQTAPGYSVQGLAVNAKHFGAPQHRPRLMILGVRDDVASRLGLEATGRLWESGYVGEVESIDLAPNPTVRRGQERTVRDAIGDLLLDQRPLARSNYVSALSGLKIPTGQRAVQTTPENHVRRRHTDQVIERFRLYQWLADQRLSHRVLGVVNYGTAEARASVEAQLRALEYPAEAPDGTHLASDPHELIDRLRTLATRKHSQKALRWEEPAKTVVTLPDDYVHPIEPRILTVRELARFQGFPDGFVFMGRETTGAHRRRFEVPQYSQVGNAVSPLVGQAMGRLINWVVDGARSATNAA